MRRKKKFVSKYADELMIISSTKVLKIELQNKEYFNAKKGSYLYKTVFYCESETGEPRMCVCWCGTNLCTGDEIQLKGRINGGVFLVQSILILQRADESKTTADTLNTTQNQKREVQKSGINSDGNIQQL